MPIDWQAELYNIYQARKGLYKENTEFIQT
jgi:hypothetical protein